MFANGANLSQLVYAELNRLNFLPDLIVLPEYAPANGDGDAELLHVSSDSRAFTNLIDGIQVAYAPARLQTEIRNLLQAHEINQVLIACWPYLIDITEFSELDLCLNLHPSLLPKYPGANPVEEQLSNNEAVFGVSLHQLSDRYDSGQIVAQKSFRLKSSSLNRKSVEAHCARIGVKLFLDIAAGDVPASSRVAN